MDEVFVKAKAKTNYYNQRFVNNFLHGMTASGSSYVMQNKEFAEELFLLFFIYTNNKFVRDNQRIN